MKPQEPIPTSVARCLSQPGEDSSVGIGINIVWSDAAEGFVSSAALRTHCPCASCKEQRGDGSHQKPLSSPTSSRLKVLTASAEEETDLKLLWPVGNYALGIKWGDGHDSGIYSYSLLRSLMEN